MSTIQSNLRLQGHTISNSGRMNGTLRSVSAPVSRKTTIRFPLSIICPNVGHWMCVSKTNYLEWLRLLTSLCFIGTVGGTYNRSAIPEFWKAGCHTLGRETPSGLVKMKVRTSFGLALMKVLTFDR